MRQLLLPFYEPCLPSPERAVLTLLNAALQVTEHAMRDAQPLVGRAVGEPQREPGEDVMLCVAKLIAGRCGELRGLIDFYDDILDRFSFADDDQIPF